MYERYYFVPTGEWELVPGDEVDKYFGVGDYEFDPDAARIWLRDYEDANGYGIVRIHYDKSNGASYESALRDITTDEVKKLIRGAEEGDGFRNFRDIMEERGLVYTDANGVYFLDNLNRDELAVLTYAQKVQIASGFIDGLSDEDIAIFANPKFDHEQMREIRLGLQHGLHKQQILSYAVPEMSVESMIRTRGRYEKMNREKDGSER